MGNLSILAVTTYFYLEFRDPIKGGERGTLDPGFYTD